MEPMLHAQHTSRKKNSAKVNLTISVVIHGLIFALGAYWAAHEGVLGKKLQELSVGLLPKEKRPEPKKEETKNEEPRKIEQPKAVEQAKAVPAPKFVPPPAAATEAVAPPPAVTIPGDFVLDPNAITSTDPVTHYKQHIESTLRAKWDRPQDVVDSDYVAEVEVALDATGRITGHEWKRGSGDDRWDGSVRKALASTKALSRPPRATGTLLCASRLALDKSHHYDGA